MIKVGIHIYKPLFKTLFLEKKIGFWDLFLTNYSFGCASLLNELKGENGIVHHNYILTTSTLPFMTFPAIFI